MPIWIRSAPERCALGLIALAMPAALFAETPPSRNAREMVQTEGQAAMERLEKAVSGQKDAGPMIAPSSLPVPTNEQRRRAFEGLSRRVTSPAMDQRAGDALMRATAGMDAEKDAVAKRIGQALGLDAPDMAALAGAAPTPDPKTWVPVLFASSSMPVTVLRSYAAQLERVGGLIAFRGMPGGMTKIGPMAKLTAETLRIDTGCDGPACAMRDVQVIVDPLVFRQHHVNQVPALAMVPGDPTRPYCERDEDSLTAQHIIYGDAALSGLLAEYARLGGTKEVADAQARLERR